jgi:hypothetical protein
MAILSLTSLTGCDSIPDFIATGTLMHFKQTTAPTSWSKQTTINDFTLRVVSGTASSGGTSAFTTVFASRIVPGSAGNTTLTTPQIPSHLHTYRRVATITAEPRFDPAGAPSPSNTGSTGGGGTHNHPFTASNMDFAVQYVDVIIAQKD